MKSSPNKIIRGANIDGVVFCTPTGDIDEENSQDRIEQENLKSLEEFWFQKGLKEGEKKGFNLGVAKGEKSGFQEGFERGKAIGTEEGACLGFERGERQGAEFAHQTFQESIDLMKVLTDRYSEKIEKLYQHAKPEIIELTISLVETMIRQELKDRETFIQLIEDLLIHANPILKGATVDITFAPESLQVLKESLKDLSIFDQGDTKRVHFAADPNMLVGDCKIETVMGLINFDIKRVLEDFKLKAMELKEVEPVEEDRVLEE